MEARKAVTIQPVWLSAQLTEKQKSDACSETRKVIDKRRGRKYSVMLKGKRNEGYAN